MILRTSHAIALALAVLAIFSLSHAADKEKLFVASPLTKEKEFTPGIEGPKPQSGRNPEFFLELRVQLELGPQPVHEGDRVAVDAGDKHLTGFVQLLHAGVAAATADLLPHPVPEPFDRVEVRTVAGQVD